MNQLLSKAKRIAPVLFISSTIIACWVGFYSPFEAVLIIIFYGIFWKLYRLVEALMEFNNIIKK